MTDGDTIRLAMERVRLYGIDAPEKSQRCEAAGACFRCGQDATNFLASIVQSAGVTCEEIERDRYGRIVGACVVGDIILSVEMVRLGHAIPYWKYLDSRPLLSAAIVKAYAEARLNGSGIHAGQFVNPSDWRKGARLDCEK